MNRLKNLINNIKTRNWFKDDFKEEIKEEIILEGATPYNFLIEDVEDFRKWSQQA